MSLLIDALKKAEEAKRRAQGSPQPVEPGDMLPLAGARPDDWSAPRASPETPPRDNTVEEPARRSAARLQAARTAFEVKAPRRRTSFALGVGVLTTLASAAIGLYFWYQLQPSGLGRSLPPRVDARPGASARLPMLTPGARNPSAASGQPAATDQPAISITRNEAAPPADTEREAVRAPVSTSAKTGERADEPTRLARAARGAAAQRGTLGAPATLPPAPPAPTKATGPVVRKGSQREVPAVLHNAWLAYQRGDLAQAGVLYRASLRNDPRNVDALTGLGAIAMRGGRDGDARRWFGRALAAQPTNAVALAAAAALEQREANNAGESRLRTLLAQRPKAHTLHFALGNILARERRWAEAQASYFAAYDLDRGNPDYLFNVAVSLDRLGKRDLARRFYGDSLKAAGERPHAFGLQAATERFNALATQ